MSEFNELTIVFHAWGLESKYYSTKICVLVKHYFEGNCTKEELLAVLPPPTKANWDRAKEELLEAQKLGISCISILDSEYPSDLTQIDDPPMLLFIMGGDQSSPFSCIARCYAVVGSRQPSIYGESVSKSLGYGLSEIGVTVVSGLARGVDSCSHQGSLRGQAKVPTIAVLGSGLLQVYPSCNASLLREVVENGGLIISEYGLRERSRPHLFPRRNRIISALSGSVVVVEAEEKSGSLITARLAMEQNRDVYAIPGPIDSNLSKGTNMLLSQGASIILSIEKFILEVKEKEGIIDLPKESLSKSIRLIGEKENSVLDIIVNQMLSFEEILYQCKFTQEELRLIMTNLLLQDLIVKRDGVYYREDVE